MIPKIHINETSPVIAILHKMMELLRMEVDPKEKIEQRAGEQTQNAFRAFQKQNQLRVDEQFVVDKPTINSMVDHMRQRRYLRLKGSEAFEGESKQYLFDLRESNLVSSTQMASLTERSETDHHKTRVARRLS